MFCFGYYGVELLVYWIPFVGALRQGSPPPQPLTEKENKPVFYAVIACLNGEESLPLIIRCLQEQRYPREFIRILVLADNCADRSAQVARSMGVDVYERKDSAIRTKGAAINELLDRRLRHETYDALSIFDLDSHVNPDFFSQMAAYLHQGCQVIQPSYLSQNPEMSTMTRIGDAAHAILRFHQRGRAAMGLSAFICGSGVVFSRQTLVRLGWHFATKRNVGDDVESQIRCSLLGIHITFAPDIEIQVGVPSHSQGFRIQRRRWATAKLELFIQYLPSFIWKAFHGQWRVLEMLFSFLLLPPLSVLFVLGGISAILLNSVRFGHPEYSSLATVAGALWIAHGAYYVLVLHEEKSAFGWRECKALPGFIIFRIWALLESVPLLFKRKNRWVPTPHGPGGQP